jgi:hypothetical protein
MRRSFLSLAVLLVACAHSPASENACTGVGRSFHALASNKDLGLSMVDQVRMIRESNEPSSPEAERYLRGMLSIIYQHPDLGAEEIRNAFLEACTTDSEGRIRLPPAWDPWRHAA